MVAYKCLKVDNGLIALVDVPKDCLVNVKNEDLAIYLRDYGLTVRIKQVEIPIPEILFDYFIENRTITIYPLEINNYLEEPILSLEISKDSILEAKGIYSYLKRDSKEKIKSID